MSWSYVSGIDSTTSGTSFTFSLPGSLQDGDLVVFGISFSPDDGTRDVACTTTGWRRLSLGGDRTVYAIYSSALPAPSFTVTGGSVSVRYSGQAYRATNTIGFGTPLNTLGAPPATSSVNVVALETLIILIGITPGVVLSWSISGSFTQRANFTGGPSLYFGESIVSSTGTVSGLSASDSAGGSVRNLILSFGEEGEVSAFFF
jgi:hypothetical protein